jgi:ATP-dependent Lhr-like helicase
MAPDIQSFEFMSHQAFRKLVQGGQKDSIFWLNAADPASLCGLGIEAISAGLPSRLDSSHLVYRGDEIVMISERNGKNLIINVEPDDPDMELFFAPLKNMLTRRFNPKSRIKIETINQQNASASPFKDRLQNVFETEDDYKSIIIYPQSI